MWASKVLLPMSLVIITLGCVLSNEPKLIITVQGTNEQTRNVLYSRDSTVVDLKRAISEQFLIPITNQRLIVGETELMDDTEMLFNHKIWNWPSIEVKERIEDLAFDLQIMVSGERIGQIQAEPTMSIAQLKMKIFFLLGFHPETINYPTQDIRLKDNQRLASLDFATDRVNLYVTGDMSHVQLRVDTSQGWSFLVDIRPETTVGYVKTIIQYRLNLPVEDQKLYLVSLELSDDSKLLSCYQIWLYESILLDIGTFRPARKLLLVNDDGSRTSKSIGVYVDETIDDIRSKVAELLQIPKKKVSLGKTTGRETRYLFEGTRLSDYYDPSVDSADIRLMPPPNQQMVYVCIKLDDGSQLWLQIGNSEKILNLKGQIRRTKGIQSDLNNMHLFLFDLELLDDKSFLDYEIGCYITLELKVSGVNPAMRIVSLTNGSTLDISVTNEFKTVQNVKIFIESEWGISTRSQRLFCSDRELLDDQKFSELNLPSQTEVYLAIRPNENVDNLEHSSN